MFFYEGQSCPVCGKHFAESDDIVACPQCGCPHHRACWKQEGHCHFEADHGTERQWAQGAAEPAKSTAAPTVRCPNCGGENPEFAEFCGHCGRDLDHDEWESTPTGDNAPHAQQYTPPTGGYAPPFQRPPFQMPLQDPYGGIPRTEQIEGVSVDQLVELIGPNSAYYLPRFFQMSRGRSKASWNWAAFLLPYNWLLYRKNLLWGILTFVVGSIISVFSQLASAPLEAMITGVPYTLPQTSSERLLLLVLFITMVAEIALSVLIGLFGNYLYMRSILKKAKRLQQNPQPQYNRSFLSTGGTSFALAVAPELLMLFIMYAILLFAPLQ